MPRGFFARGVLFLLCWGPSIVLAQELLLFGGSGHDEFIGCFTCSRYDSDSICNPYGMGSKYRLESLFNEHGEYGNEYSSSSPWNKYTSSDNVPVLVDRSGNFYGYFTINRYRSDAFELAAELRELYEAVDGDLGRVQKVLCEQD